MPPLRSPAIRVFLCDDTAAFRALLRYTLEDHPAFAVVGEAADGRAGVDGVAATHPDVVLLDLAMPVMDGLEALPRMRRVAPDAHVIALSGFTAEGMAAAVLAQGGSAYLEKGTDLGEIAATVLRCAAQQPPALH